MTHVVLYHHPEAHERRSGEVMASQHSPEDYRMIFAPDDFKWSGERAPGLPIICERDGSVSEPLLRFFGWSFRYKRTAISSMRDEAYILREWWAYLEGRGCRWDEVDDQVMIDWRERMKEVNKKLGADARRSKDLLSDQRIGRKLSTVFTFYESAAQAMLLDRELVGAKGPITFRAADRGKGRGGASIPPQATAHGSVRVWRCAEPSGRKATRRPTPDDTGVASVLAYLRSSAEHPAIGDRNWLIGRTEAEAGLRRDEVARFSVLALEAGLAKEGVKVPKPENRAEAVRAGWQPQLAGLDAVANWAEGRQAVLDGLERLERRHRTNVYITVTGKGQVTREVPFPIDLVRDLLAIGIWDVRRDQLLRWSNALQPPGPAEIFLSEKTRGPLEADAVGNLLKHAFNKCGIQGSGHRLRAYFATKLAERLWAEAFADNGFRWDQRVENFVLDRVAEALGHAKPTTTCRHYLDLGRMAYFKTGSKSALRAMRHVVNAMAAHHRRIPPEFYANVAELVERRGAGVPIDALLKAILEDPDYAVPSTTTSGSPAPFSFGDAPFLHIVPAKE
ncbi:hypothetical protein GDR74_11880 [Microvirga thermotolerans]|uniref:Tyr recombinase domain-containing protein n=2 Tax=Microvirga thermotolerans TaxID=2651334 RepID=A0A5P9JXA4_9HYPH|nr:hypothetical protein GDR74_11880 [Microvirga thermotolerans]